MNPYEMIRDICSKKSPSTVNLWGHQGFVTFSFKDGKAGLCHYSQGEPYMRGPVHPNGSCNDVRTVRGNRRPVLGEVEKIVEEAHSNYIIDKCTLPWWRVSG